MPSGGGKGIHPKINFMYWETNGGSEINETNRNFTIVKAPAETEMHP